MRFLSIISLLAATASAGLLNRGPGGTKCLKQADVDTLVEAYRSMLTQWDESKADIIADDGFFDYSDSINTVAGLQTGFPIFPNKAAFVTRQNATVRVSFFLLLSLFATPGKKKG